MLDAVSAYTAGGGRLMYMGANGFYWRIAYHGDQPGVIEVRRGEGGIRTWAAEPGEYYQSFNGEYGGLWRRNGRPPQVLTGVGFTAQGFDVSSYYRRQPGSFDPRAAFIFEGVGRDELIGDFGLVGGGAAGLELDRADPLLGTPPHALVLASSEGHSDLYMVVCEEILVNSPHLTGSQSDAGARRPGVLRDAGGRCRVLHRLHRLDRQPVAQRLRQQRVPHHRERAAAVHRSQAVRRRRRPGSVHFCAFARVRKSSDCKVLRSPSSR